MMPLTDLPSCPNCGQDLYPLQPAAAWPGWMVCEEGHRWKLPLPLTMPGLAPPLRPRPSTAVQGWLAALPSRRLKRRKRPSRSACVRPFWTR